MNLCDTKKEKSKGSLFHFLSTVEGGKAWRADGFKVEMCIWDASRKWQNCKCFSSLQHLPHHFKQSQSHFITPPMSSTNGCSTVYFIDFKYIIIAVCSNRLYADWVFSGTCCDRKVVSSNLAESTGTPPSCPNLLFERRQPIKRRLAKTECSVKRWGTKRARFRLWINCLTVPRPSIRWIRNISIGKSCRALAATLNISMELKTSTIGPLQRIKSD